VIAEIVSNSTKPAVGFKDSAADDIYKDMKGDINVGTKEDMNLQLAVLNKNKTTIW